MTLGEIFYEAIIKVCHRGDHVKTEKDIQDHYPKLIKIAQEIFGEDIMIFFEQDIKSLRKGLTKFRDIREWLEK